MDIREEIISELEEKITKLDQKINKKELDTILSFKKDITDLLNKVNNIIQLKKEAKTISKEARLQKEDIVKLNGILKSFPDFDKDLLSKLEHYIKIWGLFFNPNKDELLTILTSICNKLLNEITEKENEVSAINKTKEPVLKLIDNIRNNYTNILDDDINPIIEILKENGKSEIEILECLRKLVTDIERVILSSSQETITNPIEINRTSEEDEEEILVENEENLEIVKQRIIRILNENGYEKLVPYLVERQSPKVEKIKNDLLTYGKINNIEEIIKIFKEYNINLLEEAENGNLFKIFTLLLYSSKENIEIIFKLALEPEICICKYDEQGNLVLDEKGNQQINFTSLLERVSRFISRKKRYKRRGNATQNLEVDSEIEGNISDYIDNIRFFQKLGVDIGELFKQFEKNEKNKGAYFDIPHEKILRNKRIFDTYGIPTKVYLSKLNCFNACNPEDIIDIFIELDILEYIQAKVDRLNLPPDHPIIYRIVRTYQLAETLPNPNNLSLHQNAKQFLFRKWHGDSSGKYTGGVLDGYIANPEISKKEQKILKLDTGINKQNGSVITKQYRRNEVLTEEQLYNFDCFDKVVKAADNTSVEFIDENSLLIRKINAKSKIMANYNNGTPNVLIFGKEPNEFRISKMKFFRIYNALCKNGFNLDNDKDCVLYALTYNSILTKEQFELVKTIVDKELFMGIPMSSGRVGGRKC